MRRAGDGGVVHCWLPEARGGLPIQSSRARRHDAMKRSTERILTTHTGSLPRPADLTATLEALDAGAMPDPGAFETRVRRAVADVVRQQVEAGIDVVNDG